MGTYLGLHLVVLGDEEMLQFTLGGLGFPATPFTSILEMAPRTPPLGPTPRDASGGCLEWRRRRRRRRSFVEIGISRKGRVGVKAGHSATLPLCKSLLLHKQTANPPHSLSADGLSEREVFTSSVCAFAFGLPTVDFCHLTSDSVVVVKDRTEGRSPVRHINSHGE